MIMDDQACPIMPQVLAHAQALAHTIFFNFWAVMNSKIMVKLTELSEVEYYEL